MKKINIKHFGLIVMVFLLLILTACGCGGSKDANYTDTESILLDAQKQTIILEVQAILQTNGVAEADVSNKINEIRNNFPSKSTIEVVNTALTGVSGITEENKESLVSEINKKVIKATIDAAILNLDKFYNSEDLKSHQVVLCDQLNEEYRELLSNAQTADTTGIVKDKQVEETNNVYQLVSNYYLEITKAKTALSPIRWFSVKEDGFFNFLFNNFLVYPIGWLLQFISGLFGGYYIVGLFVVTMLIRTLMMPVYNSTNNMTLKMQLMQPDLQKLEAKYANRTDRDSQQAKQMEQMRIYKKYKMGFGGCFTMLLQFPVFLGVYQAVQRIQLTDGTLLNSPNWVEGLKTNFLGINLFMDRGETWSGQFWGIIIILLLVVGTQLLQQLLTTRLQKAQYAKTQENIPEYRRQAMQQNQAGGSMKFMMYFMIFMMGIFVFQSAAGLGIYWLFGNVYSLTQMILNHKFADRKLEKLRKKLGVEE